MSRFEQLVDEIEEYVEGCKPAPFSQSKIIVQKEQLYELLTELKLKTPDEIKRYQKIIAQKDKIISDAQAQAEQMIAETQAYAQALVEEHEIMLKAYEKAEQTINAANAQASDIMAAANQNAEEVRISALTYASELIKNIQESLQNSIDITRSNSEGLINGLSGTLSMLVANNDALASQITDKPANSDALNFSSVETETAAEDTADTTTDADTHYTDDIPNLEDEVEVENEGTSVAANVKEDEVEEAEDDEEDDDYDDDDYDDID